jgi:hypothetical protein
VHHHPNNYLSGVYYLRTHPGADTINFHDPRSQSGIIRPPVVALTAGNTDQVVLRVQNGTLLIFPAYVPHSVDANASVEERVSISFNVMFSAFAQNLSKPLWGDHAPSQRRSSAKLRASANEMRHTPGPDACGGRPPCRFPVIDEEQELRQKTFTPPREDAQ